MIGSGNVSFNSCPFLLTFFITEDPAGSPVAAVCRASVSRLNFSAIFAYNSVGLKYSNQSHVTTRIHGLDHNSSNLLVDFVADNLSRDSVVLLLEGFVRDKNMLNSRGRSLEVNLDSTRVAEVLHSNVTWELSQRRAEPHRPIRSKQQNIPVFLRHFSFHRFFFFFHTVCRT